MDLHAARLIKQVIELFLKSGSNPVPVTASLSRRH
jgi:hypothetical protein